MSARTPPKPTLRGNADDFARLSGRLGRGEIHELTTNEVSPVAAFVERNPNIVFIAGSGLGPGSCPEHFTSDMSVFAIEVVRFETNPKRSQKNPEDDEPDLNINRYIFVCSINSSHFYGYEATELDRDPTNGQVGNHWSDWSDVDDRFPTKWKPR